MKIEAIIVDVVPKKCSDCGFSIRKPFKLKDSVVCSLSHERIIDGNWCPLIKKDNYLK